jgi:hypothetical protein
VTGEFVKGTIKINEVVCQRALAFGAFRTSCQALIQLASGRKGQRVLFHSAINTGKLTRLVSRRRVRCNPQRPGGFDDIEAR